MTFNEYPDREMMMIDLANTIAGELGEALRTGDRASLCVPGGTTPGPIFDALNEVALDWDRVDVLLNDERWVPEDHDRSNTRLLRQRLLINKAAAAKYVPLYAPTETPEASMEALAAGIEPSLPLSVCLLGMGADMHTASLFPGADRLEEALSDDAPILLPMRAPGAPEPRITLSARVLRDATNLHIVITGAEKREALERARTLEPFDAPVAAVLDRAVIHWTE
ncbi:6-phosphogluconolactonase [Donghicola sp. C2-DW-16]|uniref:6-phosphogluconolactonase n=1 Tax=Donghicola mangrovi TaxID=2729614 RepID=A0ABX2PFG3_9RHOB|nr:6-phosphogluconolactonase [Donghicola mangrovi]NVO27920.1 6-phosphogluconolactonase [Donghicola mangrovi]